MRIKKEDCTFHNAAVYPTKCRGTGITVSHGGKKYGFYGHFPQLLEITNSLPDYAHLSMFWQHETDRFINQLGEYL